MLVTDLIKILETSIQDHGDKIVAWESGLDQFGFKIEVEQSSYAVASESGSVEKVDMTLLNCIPF